MWCIYLQSGPCLSPYIYTYVCLCVQMGSFYAYNILYISIRDIMHVSAHRRTGMWYGMWYARGNVHGYVVYVCI